MSAVRALLIALSTLLLASCAKDLQVNILTEKLDIDPSDKRLVLLTGSVWNPQIRNTLARRGFSVARFASQRTIERDLSPTEREQYKEAQARYGLTVYFGGQVDHCLVNENVKYGVVTYEFTDIRRNEVLFTIERGGWTGPCGFPKGNVFEELADAFLKVRQGKAVSD